MNDFILKTADELARELEFKDWLELLEQTFTDLKDQIQKKVDKLVMDEVKPLVAAQAKAIQEQVQANFAQNFIKTMIPLGLAKQ